MMTISSKFTAMREDAKVLNFINQFFVYTRIIKH